jgi:ribonuclease Z
VSNRELVVLGTASQVPTRRRNHNGYFLWWDGEGLLFDPGEGTQRQMQFAGVSASQIGRICLTHFHGDHCLGLPGVLQRMSLDEVAREVHVCYPRQGSEMFERLRHAAIYRESVSLIEHPVAVDGPVGADVPAGLDRLAGVDLPPAGSRTASDARAGRGTSDGASASGTADEASAVAAGRSGTPFRLEARQLSHSVPTVGYALIEPDGRRMLPAELAAAGIAGPDVGRLQRDGRILAGGRTVRLEEVSEPRPGQRFAFVMDTRLCDAAFALAEDADLLVCEATFAGADAALASEYGHLTAAEAGRIAAESRVQSLVLTHFSQRYDDEATLRLADETAAAFGGEVILASDLDRITVPRRRDVQPWAATS